MIKNIKNQSDWRDLNPHSPTPNVDTLPITQQSVVNRDNENIRIKKGNK